MYWAVISSCSIEVPFTKCRFQNKDSVCVQTGLFIFLIFFIGIKEGNPLVKDYKTLRATSAYTLFSCPNASSFVQI